MTEQQQNAFLSDFDPDTMAQSLKSDPSPRNKAKQFSILRTSTFLTFSPAPGRVNILNSKQKEALLPAFTSREELEKWPFERAPVAEISFVELEKLMRSNARLDGVVINPFGRALFLRRDQLADIEHTLRQATPRSQIKVKATLDYPIGLPMAVRELMEQHPEVYRVWLLAARSEHDTTDRKLFVVDLDGSPKELFGQLAQAVRLYMRQGEGFEMVKADIGLLRAAEQAGRPIYEKG